MGAIGGGEGELFLEDQSGSTQKDKLSDKEKKENTTKADPLSSDLIQALLMIGGVEQNPGSLLEGA